MAGSEGASLFSYGMLAPHDDGPASSEDGSGLHSPVLYPSAHGDSFRPYHDIPSQYDYQQGPPQPAYPPNPQSFLPRPQPHIIDFDPRPQPEWYPRQLPHNDNPYPRHAPLIVQPDHPDSPSPPSPQNQHSPTASREDRKPSSVVIACRQCRSRKIRCDSTRPVCNNCVRRNNPCEYDSVPKRRGPDKRPGTRQRSCKKRPADGSLPPPSKKKKTSANNNATPTSNNNSIGNNPGSDRLDEQEQLQPHHHHHRIKENGSPPPPGIQQRHLDKQLPPHHSSQSYQYHHTSNVPIDLHTSPIMPDQNRSSYPMGYGYDQAGYPKQAPSASSFRPSSDVAVSPGSFQPIGSPMALHHPASVHPAHQPARASYEVQKPAQLEMSHRARWERLAHNPGVPAIVDEIKFLIDGTSHMLSFINIDNLAKRLWQEDARTSIHPAFIYAALGLARLMRSSAYEGGDQGLNIALSYRAEAVRCITESRDMRWIDLTLVEGALILAIFESSAQPSFTHANAARALVDLDELVRVMGLTANDAAMADVSRFSKGGVPIVLTPGAGGGSPSAAGGVGVGVHGHGGGHPEKDDKDDVMGAPGGHGGRRCNCLAVLALSPASSQASIAVEGGGGGGAYPQSASAAMSPVGGVSPVGLSVSPALGGAMGRHVGASMPPWDPAWSLEETRNEEVRRLCWSALDLVSSFLAQCAVDGRSVPDFFLGDVSKWVLYFPGEVVEQQRAAAGAHRQQQQQQQQLHSQLYDPSSNGNGAAASSTLSPKESIWALYCRSMLLWNYCFKFRDDTSSPLYSVRGEHSPREGHSSSVSVGRAGERDAPPPPPPSSGGYGREGGGYRDGPPPATSSSSSSGGAGEYHREGAGGGGGGYRGETHSPQYRGEFKHEEGQFGRGGGYREHHQQFKHEEGVVGIPPGYGHPQQQQHGYGHPQHPHQQQQHHPHQQQQQQQPQHPHAQGGQGQGGLSREEEDDARAEEVWEAWTEVQAIEDSLDCHKCGLDSGIMYTTREYIHNVRMIVTQALRNLQGYDRGQGRSAPGPVVKRQQAEDWIYYQDLVVRRVGATINMLRSPDGVQLTQRPFRVQWFIRQLSVCLQLWNHDRTLHDALKLGKRLLQIVETMNHLWVCPSNARETAELRERLAHACVHVGLAEPLTSAYIGPAIIHP